MGTITDQLESMREANVATLATLLETRHGFYRDGHQIISPDGKAVVYVGFRRTIVTFQDLDGGAKQARIDGMTYGAQEAVVAKLWGLFDEQRDAALADLPDASEGDEI